MAESLGLGRKPERKQRWFLSFGQRESGRGKRKSRVRTYYARLTPRRSSLHSEANVASGYLWPFAILFIRLKRLLGLRVPSVNHNSNVSILNPHRNCYRKFIDNINDVEINKAASTKHIRDCLNLIYEINIEVTCSLTDLIRNIKHLFILLILCTTYVTRVPTCQLLFELPTFSYCKIITSTYLGTHFF